MIIFRLLCLIVLSVWCLTPLVAQNQAEVPIPTDPNQYPAYMIPQFNMAGNLLQRIQIRFLDTFVDPDEYIVGPGDKFSLLFTSDDITNVSSEINSDGTLFLKSVGPIKMGHVSLRQALDLITAKAKSVYNNAEFTVRLTGYRVARLNLIGEIEHPGIYYAPAIWRVSEVINLAGGVTPQAAMRSIVLRGLGQTYTTDLTRFNKLGELEYNPMVCKGNVIDVSARPAGVKMITMAGLLHRQGKFEYITGDRLADYIAFAGGAKGDLADMEIIISAGDREIDRLDGSLENVGEYELRPGSNVKLEWKENRKDYGTIEIFGEVVRPGRYAIDSKNVSLQALLDKCGGAGEDASPEMIQIFRTDWIRQAATANYTGSNTAKGLISRDPRRLWNHAEFMLQDGDSLFVPRATGMVAVSGAVASPGLVSHRDGKGIDYYLKEAGGLGYDADKSRMVVINPATGGKIKATGVKELFDGEILYVPQKESPTRP